MTQTTPELDHDDAFSRACYSRAHSNLARCYLDLHEKTVAANPPQTADDLTREALSWIAAFKTGGPHKPGQIKSEHRAIISKARAALAKLKASPPSNKTPTVPLDEQGAADILAEIRHQRERGEGAVYLQATDWDAVESAIIQASKGPTT